MTELYERLRADGSGTIEEIRTMDTARLFAELDDTLQFDVTHMDNVEWAKKPELRLYRLIVAELANRCR